MPPVDELESPVVDEGVVDEVSSLLESDSQPKRTSELATIIVKNTFNLEKEYMENLSI